MHASLLRGLLILACIGIILGRFPLPTLSFHNWWIFFLFILIYRILDIKLVTKIPDNRFLNRWSNNSTSKAVIVKASLSPIALIEEFQSATSPYFRAS
jgi:hypothetical protein